MATQNYRHARKQREESRKKRQQEKLQRKLNRGTAPPVAETPDIGVPDTGATTKTQP